jgi:hypothetical protein
MKHDGKLTSIFIIVMWKYGSVAFLECVTESNRHSGQAGDSASGRISLRLKLARPGIQEIQDFWIPAFAGMTESDS